MKRRVRLKLAYDGTDFHGWQLQPGRRTVQGTLDSALTRLQGEGSVRCRGAGRTDAGVHASGQVADARVAVRLDDAGLRHALNRILPPDLRALEVVSVPDAFHARYHAIGKRYAYELDRSAHGDPFRARYAWHLTRPLDAAAIDEALALLHGRHDWSGFTAAACKIEDRVRTMDEARFVTEGASARFTFGADGFLTHMVRNVVGTLVEIGCGKMTPGDVGRILERRDRRLAGPTAPAHGLTLMEVRYPDV